MAEEIIGEFTEQAVAELEAENLNQGEVGEQPETYVPLSLESALEKGIVVQDPEDESKIIFNVPVYIKKIAVQSGGFEAFAMSKGWQPIVPSESGMIINPVPVQDACKEIIYNFIRGVFKEVMTQQMLTQAGEEAKQKIDSLL